MNLVRSIRCGEIKMKGKKETNTWRNHEGGDLFIE